MTPQEALRPPEVPPEVAQRAVEWLVELQSGEAGAETRAAWQQWRDAHPDHDRAWRHIEAVNARWRGLASPLASATAHAALAPSGSAQRRQTVKTLALMLFAGGAAWLGEQHAPWRAWIADESTAVGRRRTLQLADGTAVTLNTASAVSIDFGPQARRVQLAAGEIFVATGRRGDAAQRARPFLVETRHGTLRALGTRFNVRLLDAGCRVAVFEGAVEVQAAEAGSVVLPAGRMLEFSSQAIGPPRPANESENAWTDGMLIASGMRLQDFVAELGRYRRGMLACDPAVAGLRISGSYPLDDTDRVLQAVSAAMPVRVQYFTRYWAMLRPLS
jgi:transmembrane sensor